MVRPLVVFVAYFLFISPSFAEDESVEYKVKAGYLYNFTKFVYWPQKESATFNLCIVGDDPFGDLTKRIEQKKVHGKSIRFFRYPQLKEPFQHCDIIYFAGSVEKKLIQKNTFDGILTVGEKEPFVRQGGMLAFVMKNDRIKLQINVQAFKKNGLEVSGKLMEVAEIIEESHE